MSASCRGDPPGGFPDSAHLLRALRRLGALPGRPDAVVVLDDSPAAPVWRASR